MTARNPLKPLPVLAFKATDAVVIWERPALSKRDRSLITVAALTTLYRPEQLTFHLEKALENGLSTQELAEAVTHLAFYAGWPAAVTAAKLLESHLAAKTAHSS